MAEDDFKLVTTSWTLGPEECCIEMDVPNIEADTILALENILNTRIREGRPITVRQVGKEDEDLKNVRSRFELPDDHVGLVRIVNIQGLDTNTCCGTHLNNLSEIQVSILYLVGPQLNGVLLIR